MSKSLTRLFLSLVMLVSPALALAQSAGSSVNNLPVSPPIVGTQLTYCPVGSSNDYKCTFAQVAAFVSANLAAGAAATNLGFVPAPVNSPTFTGTVTLPAGTAATNLGAPLGTSGATIPLNNGNNTESGTWTFGGSTAVVDLYTAPPANGSYVNGAGAYFSISPSAGHPAGDSERTGAYDIVTTTQPAWLQEYTRFISVENHAGQETYWAISTAYTLGQVVRSNGNFYQATTGGTSAGGGGGPAGTGGSIADGSVVWAFQKTIASVGEGKVGLGVTAEGYAGGGEMWGQATDVERRSGYATTQFSAIHEMDATFGDGDHAPGEATGGAYGLFMNGFSAAGYQGTVAVALSTSNTTDYFYHLGFATTNAWAVKDTAFQNGSTSQVGFKNAANVGQYAFANSSNAALAGFYDNGAEPTALKLAGGYSAAGIDASTMGGGVVIEGCTNCALYRDITNGATTAYIDIATGGTTSGDLIVRFTNSYTSSFDLNTSGLTVSGTLNVNTLPTSAGGGGLSVCVDSGGHFYKKASCP